MPDLDARAALFFHAHPQALPLYAALLCAVRERCPDAVEKFCRTQISLSCGRVFACVSFLRVRPRSELPPGSLVLTLCLPFPLSSPRVAACVQPYPGRWTHHLVLASPADLNAELLSWLSIAVDFARRK